MTIVKHKEVISKESSTEKSGFIKSSDFSDNAIEMTITLLI